MIEETVKVMSTQDRFAWVETNRKTTCGSCSVNKGCGTAVLSQVVGNKRSSLRVLNDISAKPGDEVVIGVPEGALVKGSLIIYMVPIIAMFVVAIMGRLVAQLMGFDYTDGWQVIFSFVGLGAGFVWVKHFFSKIAQSCDYQAVALRIVPSESVVQFYPAKSGW